MKVKCIAADRCGNGDCMHSNEHEPIRIMEDYYCTDTDICPIIGKEVHCAEVVKRELVLQPA